MGDMIHLPKISIVNPNVRTEISLQRFAVQFGQAQKWLGFRVLEDCKPHMPLLTGSMQQRSYVEPDGSAVVFPGPYARMQYMGVAMVDRETGRGPMMIPQGAGGDYVFRFRKGAKLVATDRPLHYSSPTAEAKWFEVAKDLNGDYWIKEVKRIGGGG